MQRKGFSRGLAGKESTCKAGGAGRQFHLLVRKIRWRRKWQPIPVFLPGKSHGQWSQVGYSPRGCRVRHDWSNWTCTHAEENNKASIAGAEWEQGEYLGYELREVDWSQIRRNFLSHLKWPCKSLAVGPFRYSDLVLWDSSLLTSLTTGPLYSPVCSRGSHVPMT